MLSIALAFGMPVFQSKHHMDGIGMLAVKTYYTDSNILVVKHSGQTEVVMGLICEKFQSC